MLKRTLAILAFTTVFTFAITQPSKAIANPKPILIYPTVSVITKNEEGERETHTAEKDFDGDPEIFWGLYTAGAQLNLAAGYERFTMDPQKPRRALLPIYIDRVTALVGLHAQMQCYIVCWLTIFPNSLFPFSRDDKIDHIRMELDRYADVIDN